MTEDASLRQDTNRVIPTKPDGVSIVVASSNDGYLLKFLLDSLLAQDQNPLPLELIVVENGSADSTAEICRDHQSLFEAKALTLKYYYLNEQGKSNAINYGASRSSFNYLMLTDADAKLDLRYFFTLNELMNKSMFTAYCGPYKAWFDSNIKTPDWFLEKYNQSKVGLPEGPIGMNYFPSGINMIFFKPIFEQLQGASEKYNYSGKNSGRGFDTELVSRFRIKFPEDDFYYSNELMVYHYTRPQFFNLLYRTKWKWSNAKMLAGIKPHKPFIYNTKIIIKGSLLMLSSMFNYLLFRKNKNKYKYFQNLYVEEILPLAENTFISIHDLIKH